MEDMLHDRETRERWLDSQELDEDTADAAALFLEPATPGPVHTREHVSRPAPRPVQRAPSNGRVGDRPRYRGCRQSTQKTRERSRGGSLAGAPTCGNRSTK